MLNPLYVLEISAHRALMCQSAKLQNDLVSSIVKGYRFAMFVPVFMSLIIDKLPLSAALQKV